MWWFLVRQWLKCRPNGTTVAELKYYPDLHTADLLGLQCADPNKSTAAIYVIETNGDDAGCDSFVTVHWSPVTQH